MDYPEGARVLNISVDLGVHGRDDRPRPPIETRVRVIPEPILRLTSIDLNACKDVDDARRAVQLRQRLPRAGQGRGDRLGPDPAVARGDRGAARRAARRRSSGPGYGLEVVSKVNDIPKGSRLAVSTNLLASLISLLMRATGQARNLTGPLDPEEAPVVVARAILGEWLGGSGGGWQDSGGVFPGVKVIQGVAGRRGRPRVRASAAAGSCPRHELLDGGRGRGRPRPTSTRPWPRAWSSSTAGWPRTSGRS